MATGARRTVRNPRDCYLTTSCAAMAIGDWFRRWAPAVETGDDVLDPFAGAGTLLEWAGVPKLRAHAFEIDDCWAPELRSRIPAVNLRIGRDSLAMPWMVAGRAPHIATNNPYGVTRESVERLQAHAYEHRRWSAALLRTDWWQHEGRSQYRPDHFLMLEWRPSFAFRVDKHGKLGKGTDQAGYVWAVWAPERTGTCLTEFLARPVVPAAWKAEHKRLARMAYDFGIETVEEQAA
jgi:hypothetical protein